MKTAAVPFGLDALVCEIATDFEKPLCGCRVDLGREGYIHRIELLFLSLCHRLRLFFFLVGHRKVSVSQSVRTYSNQK